MREKRTFCWHRNSARRERVVVGVLILFCDEVTGAVVSVAELFAIFATD